MTGMRVREIVVRHMNGARSRAADGLYWLSGAVRPRPLCCTPIQGLRMARIEDAFDCAEDCERCDGTGAVCEQHPDRPYGLCECGSVGVPCAPDRRGSGMPGVGGPVQANITMTLGHPEDTR